MDPDTKTPVLAYVAERIFRPGRVDQERGAGEPAPFVQVLNALIDAGRKAIIIAVDDQLRDGGLWVHRFCAGASERRAIKSQAFKPICSLARLYMKAWLLVNSQSRWNRTVRLWRAWIQILSVASGHK